MWMVRLGLVPLIRLLHNEPRLVNNKMIRGQVQVRQAVIIARVGLG